MSEPILKTQIKPDGEGLVKCIQKAGTPERVYNIELFLDYQVQNVLIQKYDLCKYLNSNDPYYEYRKEINLNRFLGYDYVIAGPENASLKSAHVLTKDTAQLENEKGRSFIDNLHAPIKSWEDFERFSWPDFSNVTTKKLEWLEKNLPDDMIVIGGLTAHSLEWLSWLMGYETLCLALYEQPDLVNAVYRKIFELNEFIVNTMLEFNRVRIVWGSDDLGFKTGPLLPPDSLRKYVFPIHKHCAKLAHDTDRLYILHSCGKLEMIMDDLINDVQIDAKH